MEGITGLWVSSLRLDVMLPLSGCPRLHQTLDSDDLHLMFPGFHYLTWHSMRGPHVLDTRRW